MKWEERPNVIKGSLGEKIVDEYIHDSGKFIPYNPVYEGPHPFDRIIASLDKKELYILETKTKARRNLYPDTGINLKHYYEYKHLQDKYNLGVYIAFVDEMLNMVYGNFLNDLARETTINNNGKLGKYPHIYNDIIFFPCVNMEFICKIDNGYAEELKKHSRRNYGYNALKLVNNKRITTLFDF